MHAPVGVLHCTHRSVGGRISNRLATGQGDMLLCCHLPSQRQLKVQTRRGNCSMVSFLSTCKSSGGRLETGISLEKWKRFARKASFGESLMNGLHGMEGTRWGPIQKCLGANGVHACRLIHAHGNKLIHYLNPHFPMPVGLATTCTRTRQHSHALPLTPPFSNSCGTCNAAKSQELAVCAPGGRAVHFQCPTTDVPWGCGVQNFAVQTSCGGGTDQCCGLAKKL